METSELLSKEDEKLLRDLQLIKQNIASYIGIKTIIEQIRNIIKDSKYFSFTSKRTEKYISTSRPLFIITADREKITKDTGYVFTQTTKDSDILCNLIQKEITSKYSDYLSFMLRGDEIKNILIKNNIEVNDELLELSSFITSSIFGINMELKENIIYIEFAV